jgi:hypothetical protein
LPNRYFFSIDHLTEEQLEFFGWYEVDRDGVVSLYVRPYDGEEQYVHDGPPRWFWVDDYNDAQSMSLGGIVKGPDNSDC